VECSTPYCDGNMIMVDNGKYQCPKCKKVRYVQFTKDRNYAGVS
jgi:hypothetical protein